MELSKQDVLQWAPSDVLEEGMRLFKAGAVQGTQAQGSLLGGSIKMGASRLLVRMRVEGGEVKQIDCPCRLGQQRRVCQHGVAVGLQWVKANRSEESAESMVFAAEHAPTRVEVVKWFGDDAVARVEQQLRQGTFVAREVQFQYPVGKARIFDGITEHLALFKCLPNGLISGTCTCVRSREEGVLCPHITATASVIQQIYASPERRQAYAQERARAARLANAKDLIQRGAHGTPARLMVFLPAGLAEQFSRGRIRVGVYVVIGQKTFKPQALPRTIYSFSEADENVLGLFEDVVGGAFQEVITLSPNDLLSLLRCGAQSWVGIAATKRRLAVKLDALLATPLSLEAHPEEGTLHLTMVRPGHGHCLVEGRVGFWLGDHEVRPLGQVLPQPFHSLYTTTVRIPREHFAHFFQSEYPALSAVMPFTEESVTPDLFTFTPGEPRFKLELKGSTESLVSTLRALYGNHWVTVGVPEEVSQPDPDDFYHSFGRNLEAEKAAKVRANAMGLVGSMGGIVGYAAVLRLLGEHVTAVRREGWKVELTGPIADFFERSEVIIPVAKVTSSADGKSFDVSTSYESAQGRVDVTAAEIERAIAKNHAYIEKNGTVAFIDIGAIRALRETITSCQARAGAEPGSSRIDAVHAPFVQKALERLEGIDFDASPDWIARARCQNRDKRPEAVPLGALEGTLRPYQKEGVYWLRFLESCGFCGILADEMGLGKTLQTLTWLQLPRCRDDAKRVPALIVCPTSLVENWRREAEKFVPWLKCLVVSGPDRAPLFAQVPESDLVITSYALIRRDVEFYAKCRFSVVVLDEAQAIKNQRTQNARAVKELVADTRLVLSGTPIENGVSDLWSILDFLMPKYLGPYEDFKVLYEDAIEMGGVTAMHAQNRLREKLHPFLLRRVKKDVAQDLPDKIRSVTYCTLTPAQRKVYEELRSQVREKMRGLVRTKGFERSKLEVLALLMKLRQTCCDLRLLKDRDLKPDEAPSAKLDAFMELLEEAVKGGHRILLFSQFTTMLKLIAARLEAEGYTYCYLDGATKNRLEQCAKFNQTPSIPVFLISLKAGGTGLNLTGADTVVHFDPWWNPAAEEQATDRAHRIGQKKTVQAFKFIAEDTVEEKVLELQQKKQALIEATVNTSDNAFISSLTMKEIEDLLS